MTKKSYLFVHNSQAGTRESMIKALDKITIIDTWRYDMPGVFYIISTATANELAAEFERIRGVGGLYIFSEYSQNSQGRLTKETWYLLNNLQHAPESKVAKG